MIVFCSASALRAFNGSGPRRVRCSAFSWPSHARGCIWVMTADSTAGGNGLPDPATSRPSATFRRRPGRPAGCHWEAEPFYVDLAGGIVRGDRRPRTRGSACSVSRPAGEHFAEPVLAGAPGRRGLGEFCAAVDSRVGAARPAGRGGPTASPPAGPAASMSDPAATASPPSADDEVPVTVDGIPVAGPPAAPVRRDLPPGHRGRPASPAGPHSGCWPPAPTPTRTGPPSRWTGLPAATGSAPSAADRPRRRPAPHLAGGQAVLVLRLRPTDAGDEVVAGDRAGLGLGAPPALPNACHAHPLQPGDGPPGPPFLAPDHEHPAPPQVLPARPPRTPTAAPATVTRRLDRRTLPGDRWCPSPPACS